MSQRAVDYDGVTLHGAFRDGTSLADAQAALASVSVPACLQTTQAPVAEYLDDEDAAAGRATFSWDLDVIADAVDADIDALESALSCLPAIDYVDSEVGYGDGLASSRSLAALSASAAPVAQRVVAATPGRNDPCSCGSGRKYKRCCGV